MKTHLDIWEDWNRQGGPKYPHEKVIQFCFRNFPRRENRSGKTALDLGCGGGVHAVFLAEEGFSVTGVDFSSEAIRTTRAKLDGLGLDAVLDTQRLENLELPEASFDLVISVSVLEAAGPQSAAVGLSRLPALLRPGALGLFLFAAAGDFRIQGANESQLHGYDRAEVEALFSTGFPRVWIDEYITTYRGGEWRQHDWLVTIQNQE